ncbi:MAG: hypothetical protein LAT51_01480 [Flavobacteriaceae bacterium]|nr:hypothetical protein [Flavobacteriaceae bacterium]
MQPLFSLYNDKLYEVIENDEEMIQYFKYGILFYVFEGDFEEAQNRIDVLKEDDIDLDFCIDAEKLITDNQ